MTLEIALFAAGILFLLIALLGGGFEIKELSIPNVSLPIRISSGIIGSVCISLALFVHFQPDSIRQKDPEPVPEVQSAKDTAPVVERDDQGRTTNFTDNQQVNYVEKGTINTGNPAVTEQPTGSTKKSSVATFTLPRGTHSRADAVNYRVGRKVQITWKPSTLPMIVQYYQHNKLIKEFRPAMQSGSFIEIQNPGETELKIWYESELGSVLCDNLWVWVE